ncbi:MAG: helix-turn-helix domain-containing protein [Acidobacteria bacterium]|nr:helix-turn-helix domain-containing protein [Acidobacteriota bacterium]
MDSQSGHQTPSASSPWLTAREAAARARCGVKLIYQACATGQLRAARIGGRRLLVLRQEWIDEFIERSAVVAKESGVAAPCRGTGLGPPSFPSQGAARQPPTEAT